MRGNLGRSARHTTMLECTPAAADDWSSVFSLIEDRTDAALMLEVAETFCPSFPIASSLAGA